MRLNELTGSLQLLAPHAVAVFVLGIYGYVQWLVFHVIIPSEMRDIIMRSLGTLDSALALILSWYFGSMNKSHSTDQPDRESVVVTHETTHREAQP